MKKRAARISIGIFMGAAIFGGTIWVLSKTLGNVQSPALYAGKSIEDWQQQLYGHDTGASNAAFTIVNAQVIPQLVDTMFHEPNDSKVRLVLVAAMNQLPGVQIDFMEADWRRASAASCLGGLGPAAKAAVPDLINALKGKDASIKPSAITSLGQIRSDPETVVPLLIPFLDDDNNFELVTAGALGEFGSQAKAAVPKLLPLLKAKDDDDRAAAQEALLKIDPAAAEKAGVRNNPPGKSK